MKKIELDSSPRLDPPSASAPLPVICVLCREKGIAGGHRFADLADLLAFTPVRRRARADGWNAERQRAFIAALAVTGSPRQAARAIGKHAFGAEQLRTARGGASFAAAWDSAIDLSRERELAGLREGLNDLADEHEEERTARRAIIQTRGARAAQGDDDDDEDAADAAEAMRRIRMRLTMARRLLLESYAQDADDTRRRAWEVLVGPVDWVRALKRESQADEPFDDMDPDKARSDGRPAGYNMRRPDMLLTVETGIAEAVTGTPNGMDALEQRLAEAKEVIAAEAVRATQGAAPDPSPFPRRSVLHYTPQVQYFDPAQPGIRQFSLNDPYAHLLFREGPPTMLPNPFPRTWQRAALKDGGQED